MLIVGARHITGHTITPTQFYAVHQSDPPAQLMILQRDDLERGQLLRPQGADGRGGSNDGEIVPLYACHLTEREVTFHLTSRYRHQVAHLVRGPAIVGPTPEAAASTAGLLQWVDNHHAQTSAINIGPPRSGQRPVSDAEIETKLTLLDDCDPLAVALAVGRGFAADSQGWGGGGLTHRIIRSQVYVPTSAADDYASFATRPDGQLWAKAKRAPKSDPAIRREYHYVATDLEAGLAWARSILGAELRPIGEMTRTCWDLVTDPSADGDMCIITVDRTVMNNAPLELNQVEVEYGTRYARLPATEPEARAHARAVAANVQEILMALGIEHRHDDLGKVTFFRRIWGQCNA